MTSAQNTTDATPNAVDWSTGELRMVERLRGTRRAGWSRCRRRRCRARRTPARGSPAVACRSSLVTGPHATAGRRPPGAVDGGPSRTAVMSGSARPFPSSGGPSRISGVMDAAPLLRGSVEDPSARRISSTSGVVSDETSSSVRCTDLNASDGDHPFEDEKAPSPAGVEQRFRLADPAPHRQRGDVGRRGRSPRSACPPRRARRCPSVAATRPAASRDRAPGNWSTATSAVMSWVPGVAQVVLAALVAAGTCAATRRYGRSASCAVVEP